MTMDMQEISAGLKLGEDGIWYGKDTEKISYPTEGNDSCFAIEENSFWFKHRNSCIASVVKNYPPESDGTIFDIGGGNGFVSLGLVNSGLNVALVEPGKVGASNAKRRGLANVICATVNTAKFKRNSLPAVGLFDVIEHIEDDLAFLKSIRGLMKKGARIYVTVPAYSALWSQEDIFSGHFRRYALGDILNVLQSAGFKIEFSSYIFRFLPLATLFLRALPYRIGLSRSKRTQSTTSRDHAVKGGPLAKIFNFMLQDEIDSLNNRKVMSFGGSCLVVAKCP